MFQAGKPRLECWKAGTSTIEYCSEAATRRLRELIFHHAETEEIQAEAQPEAPT
jgi:hypothetical protein